MFDKQHPSRHLGRALRERREAAGISQASAAKAAGIGRSTMIHLEQGSTDVRLSNLLAVAEVLGVAFGLQASAPELAERRRLRAESDLALARRRQAHSQLALDLALGRPAALRALKEARSMVSLWRKHQTCSEYYIETWSRILKGAPAEAARRIRDIDEAWLDALLQNTPFSHVLARA